MLMTPQMFLPRRFVLYPGVASPLTCRHPKPLRCTCHAEAAAAAAPPGGKPAYVDPPPTKPRANAKPDPELHKKDMRYRKIIALIVNTIRSFPDALAAVQQVFESNPDFDSESCYNPG